VRAEHAGRVQQTRAAGHVDPAIQLANPDNAFSTPPCQSLVFDPVAKVPTIDFNP
jgi:hypothetical protein